MSRLRRYSVVERIDAWSEREVLASNKAEAIEKFKRGEYVYEGDSGGFPTGHFKVTRVTDYDEPITQPKEETEL